MSELEDLKRQKREIEQKIKELMNPVNSTGTAKLDLHRYSRGDEWYVAVKVRNQNGNPVWRGIISNSDRQKCISQIDEIIADLTELKEKLNDKRGYN